MKLLSYPCIILICILLFFSLTNFIWLYSDTLPPSWDQAAHLTGTWHLYDFWKKAIIGHRLFTLQTLVSLKHIFLNLSHQYPPIFYFSSLPFVLFFGFSEHHALFANFIYLAILIASTYGIGRSLYNVHVGLLSAALVIFFPIVFGLSREYLIDFPLISITALVQYIIVISNGGTQKNWYITLGFLIGISLLLKYTSLVFILPPLFYTSFVHAYKEKNKSTSINKLIITLVIASIISLPWYFNAYADLMQFKDQWFSLALTVENDPAGLICSLSWYANNLIFLLLSPVLSIFFLIGLALLVSFSKKWTLLFFLVSCIVPPYFILALAPNKDVRYLAPILPAMAILTCAGISSFPKKPFLIIANFLLIMLGLLQFTYYSFNFPRFVSSYLSKHYYARPPAQEDWKINDIMVDTINSCNKKEAVIGILADCKEFNSNQFIFYSKVYNLKCEIIRLGDTEIQDDVLSRCDAVIVKSPKLADSVRAYFRGIFLKQFTANGGSKFGFKKSKEYDLPDLNKAIIYLRS